MHRIVLLPLGAAVLTLEGYFLSWTPQGRRQSSGWWWFSSSYSTYSGLHMSHLHAIRLCSGASSSKVRKRPFFFICQKDNYQARVKNDLYLNVYWLGMRFWHPNFCVEKNGISLNEAVWNTIWPYKKIFHQSNFHFSVYWHHLILIELT